MMERYEGVTIRGQVKMELFDVQGDLVDFRDWSPNMIVYAGNDLIRDCLGQSSGQPAGAQWIAIGTGTDAVSGADTTLGTESSRKPSAYAEAETGGGLKDRWTEIVTFGAGEGTGAVTESGCFNASGAGSMFCRQTFAVINKGAGDSLQMTWQFTIS